MATILPNWILPFLPFIGEKRRKRKGRDVQLDMQKRIAGNVDKTSVKGQLFYNFIIKIY